MPDGHGIDFPLPIHLADTREEIAERQRAAHGEIGQAEGRADLGNAAPFLHQPGETGPARDFVRIEPGDVLDKRGLDGAGIVRFIEYRAGQQDDFGIGLTGFG
ncbi:hypothetical protein [Novosphingobium sp.]|uniref:hypothetical protein n=1 Tax=Novosphingobium sp. TaxID=1874826 RepID=UPI0028A83ED5|nr:hypothetical protein [Novosphingobium sp.]